MTTRCAEPGPAARLGDEGHRAGPEPRLDASRSAAWAAQRLVVRAVVADVGGGGWRPERVPRPRWQVVAFAAGAAAAIAVSVLVRQAVR
ncbi:MAG: hypothetical protein OEY23_01515 [Acidimicrobiia bacterium]|nr:hypothetical protein [Acidimicrobiia bacterium]